MKAARKVILIVIVIALLALTSSQKPSQSVSDIDRRRPDDDRRRPDDDGSWRPDRERSKPNHHLRPDNESNIRGYPKYFMISGVVFHVVGLVVLLIFLGAFLIKGIKKLINRYRNSNDGVININSQEPVEHVQSENQNIVVAQSETTSSQQVVSERQTQRPTYRVSENIPNPYPSLDDTSRGYTERLVTSSNVIDINRVSITTEGSN